METMNQGTTTVRAPLAKAALKVLELETALGDSASPHAHRLLSSLRAELASAAGALELDDQRRQEQRSAAAAWPRNLELAICCLEDDDEGALPEVVTAILAGVRERSEEDQPLKVWRRLLRGVSEAWAAAFDGSADDDPGAPPSLEAVASINQGDQACSSKARSRRLNAKS